MKSGTSSPATATHTQLMELTMQVMMQNASTYHAICLPKFPLLRNTKLRWIGKLMHSPMTMAIIYAQKYGSPPWAAS